MRLSVVMFCFSRSMYWARSEGTIRPCGRPMGRRTCPIGRAMCPMGHFGHPMRPWWDVQRRVPRHPTPWTSNVSPWTFHVSHEKFWMSNGTVLGCPTACLMASHAIARPTCPIGRPTCPIGRPTSKLGVPGVPWDVLDGQWCPMGRPMGHWTPNSTSKVYSYRNASRLVCSMRLSRALMPFDTESRRNADKGKVAHREANGKTDPLGIGGGTLSVVDMNHFRGSDLRKFNCTRFFLGVLGGD